jgi:hypothetical protein
MYYTISERIVKNSGGFTMAKNYSTLQIITHKGRISGRGNWIEGWYKIHIGNDVLIDFAHKEETVAFLREFLTKYKPLRIKPYGLAAGVLYNQERPPVYKGKYLYMGRSIAAFIASEIKELEKIDKDMLVQKAVFKATKQL